MAETDYPHEVIEAWAPLPITKDVQDVLVNRAEEIPLAALLEEEIVGIGAVIPLRCELRACYVAPRAARRNVGSALVRDLERIAREHHAPVSRFCPVTALPTAEASQRPRLPEARQRLLERWLSWPSSTYPLPVNDSMAFNC